MTYDEVKKYFTYDPKQGLLIAHSRRGVEGGKPAGWVNHLTNRRYICFNRKFYLHSRLVYLYHNGYMPNGVIDHINGNPSDDRIENLRDVTYSINQRNMKLHKGNKSGFMGVWFNKDRHKWEAYINVNGKRKRLYYGKSKAKAIVIRKAAESLYGFHKNHGRIAPTKE